MDKNQLTALAAKMIEATRAFVSKAEVSINARLDERLKLLDRVQGMVDEAVAKIPAAPPGRDALEIEPLTIDERKSYPRGTWANYNNGLVRATRKTDPLVDGNLEKAGWAVAVEGVAAIVVSQAQDAHSFEVAAMLTSGIKMVSAFSIPAVAAADVSFIKAEVNKAVAALPKPKDGESVHPDILDEMILARVETAVASLPDKHVMRDTRAMVEQMALAIAAIPKPKDFDPVLVKQLVVEAVAALPKPKDGRSVTIDDVRPIVVEAVAALPKPKDGTSITVDDVRPLVAEAVAALPKPKDGESIHPDAVMAMVRDVVAALPKPKDGRSVTAEDIRPLIAEAVAALPKPKDGDPGESIHPDTVLVMVRDTVEKAVAALPKPKDGEHGRDATELRPLASIDESRSYPAGTYAKHNGGEIRAERRTDPVKNGDLLAAGWTVAREGVAAVAFVQGDDPREIACSATLTSGASTITVFNIPMVIDLGVWREGEYRKGDHVSYDGSGWIAQRATTAKPGTSPDWRLSTKRGRDGKDAGEPIVQRGTVRVK